MQYRCHGKSKFEHWSIKACVLPWSKARRWKLSAKYLLTLSIEDTFFRDFEGCGVREGNMTSWLPVILSESLQVQFQPSKPKV